MVQIDFDGKFSPALEEKEFLISYVRPTDILMVSNVFKFSNGFMTHKRNPNYHWFRTTGVKFVYNDLTFKDNTQKPFHKFSDVKLDKKSKKDLDYITNRDLKVNKKVRGDINRFLRRFEGRMELKEMGNRSFPQYLDGIKNFYEEEMRKKGIDLDQRFSRGYKYEHGTFEKYIELPSNLWKFRVCFVDGKIVGITGESIQTPDVTSSSTLRCARTLGEEQLYGLSEFMYYYSIKNSPTYYFNMGSKTSKNVEEFKKKFSLYIHPFFVRGITDLPEVEQANNLNRWFK